MVEQWRPVVGLEGRYEVSDHGQVRSYVKPAGMGLRVEPRTLRQVTQTAGYAGVTLYDGLGESRRALVHLLVLAAFVGPRPEGMIGSHENDDRTNNTLGNLLWETQSQNIARAHRNGRIPRARGAVQGLAKLDDEKVRALRRAHAEETPQPSYSALGRRFGVTKQNAAAIVKRRTWRHVV